MHFAREGVEPSKFSGYGPDELTITLPRYILLCSKYRPLAISNPVKLPL